MFNFKVVFPGGKIHRVCAENLTEAEDKVVKYMQVKSISSARVAGKTTLTEIKRIANQGSTYWRHKGFKFFTAKNLSPFQINYLFNEVFS